MTGLTRFSSSLTLSSSTSTHSTKASVRTRPLPRAVLHRSQAPCVGPKLPNTTRCYASLPSTLPQRHSATAAGVCDSARWPVLGKAGPGPCTQRRPVAAEQAREHVEQLQGCPRDPHLGTRIRLRSHHMPLPPPSHPRPRTTAPRHRTQNMASQKSRREQYTTAVANYAAPQAPGPCASPWSRPARALSADVCSARPSSRGARCRICAVPTGRPRSCGHAINSGRPTRPRLVQL